MSASLLLGADVDSSLQTSSPFFLAQIPQTQTPKKTLASSPSPHFSPPHSHHSSSSPRRSRNFPLPPSTLRLRSPLPPIHTPSSLPLCRRCPLPPLLFNHKYPKVLMSSLIFVKLMRLLLNTESLRLLHITHIIVRVIIDTAFRQLLDPLFCLSMMARSLSCRMKIGFSLHH
ncbi:hypothetical protein HanIR_Chr13g0625701 [Helianthus annuus]|nr:hypothetical protein HanIR_Chr13g0625701 [Helianthus annuus]